MEQALQDEVLLAQPRVVLVLVGVHGAAEDEDGAVVVERPRGRRPPRGAPLLELVPALRNSVGEHPRADVVAVDHREDVHGEDSTAGSR